LNALFRFYKYSEGQYFKWHQDGSVTQATDTISLLTLLVYLNDNFAQGYTQFPWDKIAPKTGTALIFPHKLTHRAIQPVGGVKYVLRTDVFYGKK